MAFGPESIVLEGRTALVTGAAAGIGRAIAETLACCGANLALCDRNGEALTTVCDALVASGRRVTTGVLDVRDAAAVAHFVGETVGAHRSIDIVINNAGGTFEAPFEEISANAQTALIDENFSSVTHVIRAALPHFPERGGSIVNITSIEAHRAAPGFAVYAAMKAAVENLTRSLALELADRAIRVNAVAPDAIPTPGTGDFALDTPLQRLGVPDDVAGAVLYLVSDLSRFVTGTSLGVDGGSAAAGGWRRGQDGRFGLA